MELTNAVSAWPSVRRFRFDMKGNIMTDMTLPRPKEVPPLDFDILAAKLKEEEVIPTDRSMTLHTTDCVGLFRSSNFFFVCLVIRNSSKLRRRKRSALLACHSPLAGKLPSHGRPGRLIM